MLGLSLSKTQLFLCFHRVHTLRKIRKLGPSRAKPETCLLIHLHYFMKVPAPDCGAKFWRLIWSSNLNQKSQEKTQPTSKWSNVSCSWSHKGHLLGCPCLFYAKSLMSAPFDGQSATWRIYIWEEPKFSKFCGRAQTLSTQGINLHRQPWLNTYH